MLLRSALLHLLVAVSVDAKWKIFKKLGDPVTLHSGLTEIRENDEILWKFGPEDTLIAETRNNRAAVNEEAAGGRFRDRVRVDHQTGSLTISHTRSDHTGHYQLEINGVRKIFSLMIINSDPVEVSATEGDPVTLRSRLTDLQDDDGILWKFESENTLLVEKSVRDSRFTVNEEAAGGIFRARLTVDHLTGSLTISETTRLHTGHYLLEINAVRNVFSLTVNYAEDVSVTKGDPVTLHSGLTEIQADDDDDEIRWKFGHSTTLAAINVRNSRLRVNEEAAGGRFRDRVRVDHQTGSLTISHTRSDHTGHYQLEINTWMKIFYLTVYDAEKKVSAMEGESVTLHSPLADVQKNTVLWRFRKHRTAINGIGVGICRVGEFEEPADEILRRSMKLDPKTGSLIIPNATTEHSGPYMLEMNASVETLFSLTVHPRLSQL